MPADDKMTVDERRKYLKRMAARYAQANRRQRGALLSEMEVVTGLHRKSLPTLPGESSTGQAGLVRLWQQPQARPADNKRKARLRRVGNILK